MKIANIVIDKGRKLLNDESFIFVTSELPENITSPTLIVGWELVKRLFPNQSILDKKIKDNLFWTFTKNEKRVEYDKDIIAFYRLILDNIILNNLEYYFFDIFKVSLFKIKNLINLIKSDIDKHIYIYASSFIYLYYEKYVIGISIEDLEYIGVSKDKILKLLYKNKFNHIFYNTDFISMNIWKVVSYNKVIIPYLHSIL